MNKAMFFILWFFVVGSFTVLSAGERSDTVPADTHIVAKVGPYTITVDNLLESYNAGPAFVKLRPDPMRSHLRYMVYEHLLAIEAKDTGLDTTRLYRKYSNAIEEDLTVDELYHEDILSNVNLTEENINAGVQKARVNLRLRWLFSESIYGAENLYNMYKNGTPFDSLFAMQDDRFSSGVMRELETTQLKLERDNLEFARQLYDVGAGEVSQPIQGPDGFYIVKIDQIWQNPILPRHEYIELRDQSERVLTQIRADELSEQYIQEFIREKEPEVIINGMYIVRAYLAKQGLTEEQREDWDIPMSIMTEGGPQNIINNPEFLEIPVAITTDFTLTAADYLEWFEIRQLQLKRSSREAFNASIKQSVQKMVQDKLLSRRAYGRELHKLETVQLERKRWEAKMLYELYRRHVIRSIDLNEARLMEHFFKHRQRYVDEHGNQLEFPEAKDRIKGEIAYAEKSEHLFRTLQRLERNHTVEIDEEVVELLEKKVEEHTTPINVMFYKPGGTFPRVAYPTIDHSWYFYDN